MTQSIHSGTRREIKVAKACDWRRGEVAPGPCARTWAAMTSLPRRIAGELDDIPWTLASVPPPHSPGRRPSSVIIWGSGVACCCQDPVSTHETGEGHDQHPVLSMPRGKRPASEVMRQLEYDDETDIALQQVMLLG
ncbi:hypothetical protein MHUMG1_10555 [Metarhizium humberi]|uniref:Uncharacterized protein n=1 Tax=Metarhizium humberi TaxID=2596975 RepID=A0A9P8M147_9HYPO|nr:hypothetical protein MHUMG1_10555 [Metarhizium humberi]